MRRSQAASPLVDVDRVPWVAMLGSHALPGGDNGIKVSQDRGGDHGLRLSRLEPVVLTGGQMPVAGAVDGIGALGSPDGPPGRDRSRGRP